MRIVSKESEKLKNKLVYSSIKIRIKKTQFSSAWLSYGIVLIFYFWLVQGRYSAQNCCENADKSAIKCHLIEEW